MMKPRLAEALRALERRPILLLWLRECRGALVALVAHFLFMTMLLGPVVRMFVPEPRGPKLFGVVQLPANRHDAYPDVMKWLDPILWLAGWSLVGAWARRRMGPALERAHAESEALEREAGRAAEVGDLERSLVLLSRAGELEPSDERRGELARRRDEQQARATAAARASHDGRTVLAGRRPEQNARPASERSAPRAATPPDATGLAGTSIRSAASMAGSEALGATLPRGVRRIGPGGRFVVERELGRGVSGAVLLAEDTLLGRRIAVKELAASDDPEASERFLREARSLAQLSSPHIVQVHDLVEDDGRVLLCMEYCAGGDLTPLLRAGPLAPAAAADLGAQIARGLAAAHGQGIVHRDLKPANVLRAADGTIKVADFGLARLVSSSLTHAGTVMGTPAYMAPEQALGRPVDGRADLYALGCLLFEALAGGPCYAGTITEVLAQHASAEPPTPLAGRAPGVPSGLARIVDRLRAKDPEARPASALEVAQALEREGAPLAREVIV